MRQLFALSRKQMSGHIYPKTKRPVNPQRQARRVWILVWDMHQVMRKKWHLQEEGFFRIFFFFFLNGGQCREERWHHNLTYILLYDLKAQWVSFVSFCIRSDHRPRGPRNRESAVAFESGATQNQFITATAKWINRLIEPECYDCYIAHHRRINGILIGIDQYQSNSYMS